MDSGVQSAKGSVEGGEEGREGEEGRGEGEEKREEEKEKEKDIALSDIPLVFPESKVSSWIMEH